MAKKLRIVFLIFSVLSTVYIFSNSFKTATVSSGQSGRIVNFLLRFLEIDRSVMTVIIRKLAHISEFFIQAMFMGAFFLTFKEFFKNIIYILFFGLLTAVTDEFIQLFSPGRGGMVQDVFIDFSGTVMAVIICTFIFVILKRRRNKNDG